MFDWLSSIFSSNTSYITYSTLVSKLLDWRKYGVFPRRSELPRAIDLPKEFWKQVIFLYRDTKNDGNERLASVWSIGNDVIVAPFMKGTKSEVSGTQNLKVMYKPLKNSYIREVYINTVLVSSQKIAKPSQGKLEFLFNLHTHPLKEQSFSYWSGRDILSFVQSNAAITCLVTDKLHLLIRTDLTPETLELDPKTVVNDNLIAQWHMAEYLGNFRTRLRRMNPTPH